MTDLRKAAEMAIDAMMTGDVHKRAVAIIDLRKALAQPAQEPVAWACRGILHEFDPSEFATSEVTPLYTAPPKREWVGLTDEEKDWCINGTAWVGEEKEVRVKIVEAIEAKLKEKNT